MRAVENCENCGRAIGRLEQPYVWRKHVVCAGCHVHLSAPAPAAAAARPSQAPPLPAREPDHVRIPPPQRHGPPAPVALRPEAPAKPAAPMLLCTACGHAYPFGDVVSDHGKVICRTCALAAAAQKARTAAREKRTSAVVKGAVAAAVLLAVGGGVAGTYIIIKSRPDRLLSAANTATPRAGDATADEIMSRPGGPDAAGPMPPAGEAASVESAVGSGSSLFPEAGFSASAPAVASTPAPAPVEPAKPQPISPGVSPAPAPAAPAAAPPPPPAAAMTPAAAVPDASPLPAPAAGASAPVAAPAATRAAAPAPPAEGTAAWFAQKGRALLTEGKYPLALEQFNAAIKKDRNCAEAWHGSALCFQNMGDRESALSRLEKAVTLYSPPNRAAVYNCAVANLLAKNPMRAAKLAGEYLSGEGAGLDEQMHTLMGRSLFDRLITRQARQHPAWREAQAFYFAYNEQLESARRDGRKRWGGEWVPARDATEKWNRFRSRQQNFEGLVTAVDRATKAKKDAWDKLYDQRSGMRLIGDREQREGQQRYEHAARQEIAVRQQLRAAEVEYNSTERPPFPQLMKFVSMDAAAPGTAGTAQKVVIAPAPPTP